MAQRTSEFEPLSKRFERENPFKHCNPQNLESLDLPHKISGRVPSQHIQFGLSKSSQSLVQQSIGPIPSNTHLHTLDDEFSFAAMTHFGFLGICSVLHFKRSWRISYFQVIIRIIKTLMIDIRGNHHVYVQTSFSGTHSKEPFTKPTSIALCMY